MCLHSGCLGFALPPPTLLSSSFLPPLHLQSLGLVSDVIFPPFSLSSFPPSHPPCLSLSVVVDSNQECFHACNLSAYGVRGRQDLAAVLYLPPTSLMCQSLGLSSSHSPGQALYRRRGFRVHTPLGRHCTALGALGSTLSWAGTVPPYSGTRCREYTEKDTTHGEGGNLLNQRLSRCATRTACTGH